MFIKRVLIAALVLAVVGLAATFTTQEVLNRVYDSVNHSLRMEEVASVAYGSGAQIFTGTASDVVASIPSAANFTNDTYRLIIWNYDGTNTLYAKITGTGATTADIQIRPGDPPLYLDFRTSRISLICATGKTAAYQVLVLEKVWP